MTGITHEERVTDFLERGALEISMTDGGLIGLFRVGREMPMAVGTTIEEVLGDVGLVRCALLTEARDPVGYIKRRDLDRLVNDPEYHCATVSCHNSGSLDVPLYVAPPAEPASETDPSGAKL